MGTSAIGKERIAVMDIRTILSEDFSQNKVDRIIMAVKTNAPEQNLMDLDEIRRLLEQDFSLMTINRTMMTLKLFCCKAFDA